RHASAKIMYLFFNDTATTEIYTLSLHDALPIFTPNKYTPFALTQKNCYILGIESSCDDTAAAVINNGEILSNVVATQAIHEQYRSEEHTSELQSRENIVCRLLLEKKKKNIINCI